MREWFRVEAAAEKGKGGGEILIYGSIGKRWWDEEAVGAKDFVKELQGLVKAGPGDVHIRINSPGGDVADGMAIYNAIRAIKDRVVCTIDSVAYSMASVIAVAGRETRMQDTGQFMIHNPIVGAYGGEQELESALKALKTAKSVLLKAYVSKTGKPEEAILSLMGATTWMTADEAKEHGFVDEVIDETSLAGIAACFDAAAWASYYQGRGPMPVDVVNELEDGGGDIDAPENGEPQAEEPAPLNGGDAPEEARKMPKYTEIKAACPGASPEFVGAQAELCEADETRTLDHVKDAYIAEQAKALAEAVSARIEAEKKPAEQPKPEAPGVTPLATGGAPDGGEDDPIAFFNGLVAGYEKQGMDRPKAIREACVKNKDAYRSYLRAYNEAHGRNHLAG